MLYGYARVSTKEQNEQRQLTALKNFGVCEKNIFTDKESGKSFERTQYIRLVKNKLKAGDILAVKSIDRLGRSYSDILDEWRRITKKTRAEIVVLDIPLLDTRHHNDLTGILIGDIVLQLLSYVAQSERENIRQRQKEGIDEALKKGVKFGRPSLILPDDFPHFFAAYKRGEVTCECVISKFNISKTTFYRWGRLVNAGRGCYSR